MHKKEKQRGQSIVEFALVIPLLLIFVMGIIEFGFMFNAYLTISSASREGARLGSLGENDAAIEIRVDTVSDHLNLNNITVNVTPSSRSRGDMVSVTVTYDYQLITPIISNILSPFVNLEAETVMRVE
ncbi:MAG: pilus assembly protein [Clostridia bacterium]|nr:pilus assembly protein [Clostridia bacterium]